MNRLIGKILIIIALSIMCSGIAQAGDAGRESQFSIGSGVRASGIGGGFVGLADDASAVYWNQAAMAFLDYQEVHLMHSTLFEGSIYDVATYVYPTVKLGSFGVSFMRLGTGDIIKRDNWLDEGEFSYSISQFILAYGRELKGGFCLGTSLKMVNQSLDNNSTYGVGVDLSFYKRLSKNMTVGVLFQDVIPPRLRLSGNLETSPYNAMIGLGIKDIKLFSNFTHKLNFAVELPEERSLKVHAGFESTYRDWLDIRAGYDRDNLAFGFGLYYKRLKFNYAYKIMDGITDSHRFGFSFTIGTSVSDKIRHDIELQNARGSHLILDDRQKQFNYYFGIANEFYRSNELDSSLVYYQRALAYRQGDTRAKNRIRNINAIRKNQLNADQVQLSDDELRQTLLDEYVVRVDEFIAEELYTSALGIVEAALTLDPDNQEFIALKNDINRKIEDRLVEHLDNARAAEREDRLTDAVTSYNQILQYSPEDATVKRLVSRISTTVSLARSVVDGAELFYNEKYSEAEATFRKVLQMDPDNSVAKELMGQITALRKSQTEQESLEQDQKIWPIYLNALEHYQNGNYQRAIELWDEVLKSYPGNEKTLENIKQARLRLQSEP